MIAVAIEVYSAVSNYYDRFAKSRVILVKKKLREEQNLNGSRDRAQTVDEVDNVPTLLDNTSGFKVKKNYLDFEFNKDGRVSKRTLFSVNETDEEIEDSSFLNVSQNDGDEASITVLGLENNSSHEDEAQASQFLSVKQAKPGS